MGRHEIDVTIGADGEIEFHMKGMKGKGCLKVLEEFEKALGKVKSAPTPTAEMYQTEQAKGKVGR